MGIIDFGQFIRLIDFLLVLSPSSLLQYFDKLYQIHIIVIILQSYKLHAIRSLFNNPCSNILIHSSTTCRRSGISKKIICLARHPLSTWHDSLIEYFIRQLVSYGSSPNTLNVLFFFDEVTASISHCLWSYNNSPFYFTYVVKSGNCLVVSLSVLLQDEHNIHTMYLKKICTLYKTSEKLSASLTYLLVLKPHANTFYIQR